MEIVDVLTEPYPVVPELEKRHTDSELSEKLAQSIREFHEKNEIFAQGTLRGPFDWIQLNLDTFIEEIFVRDGSDVPFQDVLCPDYLLWKAHMEQQKISKALGKPETDFDYADKFAQRLYNGIAVYWTGKFKKVKRKDGTVCQVKCFSHIPILRNDPLRLNKIREMQDCYMAPVTYVGKSRSNENARYIYAIAIDLDDVGPDELEGLFVNCTREYVGQHGPVGRPLVPVPNIITNSGHGLHVYYLLAKPVALTSEPVKKVMDLVKENLTGIIHKHNTTRKEGWEKLSLLQSFRLPETKTKFGETVTAWQNLDRSQPYTIEELNDFFYEDKLTMDQIRTVLSPFDYSPSSVTAAEAQRRWPEWYQARVVEKKWVSEASKWKVKRNVYDWWKDKLWHTKSEIVGHRFWCMLCLYIYAIKCDIPLDEVNKDAEELMVKFESFTRDKDNHFTLNDVYDAAYAYNVNYCKFPIWKIDSLTTIHIERNVRKGRKQNIHLKLARNNRDVLVEEKGDNVWWEGNGRKKGRLFTEDNSRNAQLVAFWRYLNPDIQNKSACSNDTGLSRPTVTKWWNATLCQDVLTIRTWKIENMEKYSGEDKEKAIRKCKKDTGIPIENIRKWWMMTTDELAELKNEKEDERKLVYTRKMVGRLGEEGRKIYEWKVEHSMWPQLSNSMENAARDLDIPLETVRKLWNSVDKLYYDPEMVNDLTTSKDFVSLAKLFEPGSNYRVEGYTHKQTVDIVTSGKWKDLDWDILI